MHKLILSAKKAHHKSQISREGSQATFTILSGFTKPNGVTLPAVPSQKLVKQFASFLTEKIQAIQQTITTVSVGLMVSVDLKLGGHC